MFRTGTKIRIESERFRVRRCNCCYLKSHNTTYVSEMLQSIGASWNADYQIIFKWRNSSGTKMGSNRFRRGWKHESEASKYFDKDRLQYKGSRRASKSVILIKYHLARYEGTFLIAADKFMIRPRIIACLDILFQGAISNSSGARQQMNYWIHFH